MLFTLGGDQMERRTNQGWFIRLFAIILATVVVGCRNQRESMTTQTQDAFETIRAAVQSWVSGTDSDELIISSSYLKQTIVDDWDHQKGKYQIVSVRTPDDYDRAGHIPHAINSYWVDILTDESLTRLDLNKILILYCTMVMAV